MSWSDYSPFRRRETITPVSSDITVYGTTWCGMTQMVRRYLDRLGISYTYRDIEEDDGAEKQLRWITGGYTNHPTIVIDGHALIEPELEELENALSENGYL
ncbi:MAG TPA: glutaredoxin family protein [Bacteroidales bacterium]|jgi:mycoredoxin|nr:glutaredoxin family protein [Bacteroidales bacterium]